ncbi:hypothetical protein CKM354_000326900 [Cercospora kikuchii]|uniref:Uncharacterized protein n=1 Tax=Cercospora kikuchii TaxID=84275 RepID=A0A9P3CEH9_9PEZI|nr:uncharacterized protein CKM354_000326900 [Cercospora kikuchii]GIZ39907.1 hypothetical protein CKM354_000326900 [Cercospora kikuchii]
MPVSKHVRIARAPRQQKFLPRRTSIRPRRPRVSASSLHDQSTLTQIDFVQSTPQPSAKDSSNFSDEEASDYNDNFDMPPKKRRKMYDKTLKQTTVTQNWRDFVRPDSTEPADLDVSPESNDERGEMHQQERESSAAMKPETKLHQSERKHFPSVDHLSRGKTPSQATFDHARHLLSIASSPQSRQDLLFGSSDKSDDEVPSTRPTTASSAASLKTPQRPRRTEIPSSQTPSSIHLSRSGKNSTHQDRLSPLRERSINLQTTTQPEHAPHLLDDSFEGHELEQTTRHDEPEEDFGRGVWTARHIFTPEKHRRAKGLSPKKRASQDYETGIDDSGDSESDHPLDGTIDERTRDTLPEGLPHASARFSRRSTLVQESQDGYHLEDEDIAEWRLGNSDVDGADIMTGAFDPMFQQTFDPINAALERDAGRFYQADTPSSAQMHYLRASQISTVMPTQHSRPGSSHEATLGESEQPGTTAVVNTLASSPFPLPPCDESLKRLRREETQGTDVSLPPPRSTFSAERG